MFTQTTILIVSFLLSVLIVAFVYLLFTPKSLTQSFIVNKNAKLDPKLKQAINFFGGDIASLIPQQLKARQIKSQKLDKLFITSGNPWKLTKDEFFIVKIFMSIGAFIGTVSAVLFLSSSFGVFTGSIAVIAMTYGGFIYPDYVYNAEAKDRKAAFTRELPEAIDFLFIAMDGGPYSFSSALELVIKYLPEGGVIREEFQRVVADLSTGLSLEHALNEFANRAPTEAIESFVNSLNNASKLNAPLSEILRNQSDASRREKRALVETAISKLSTAIYMAFGPTSFIAILLVVLAPTAATLSQAFS